ncbi:hypothetical protein PUNSTDRAFT_56670 [Punctularia strigosozonata HHB-11173 SS5]|uniref:uncharacterized protein n=1 Tax=Punctularia strigosozonata (strain HHB-11173) TaxID=741275 RepID=UPI00044162C7|nr:uncharacterized protein PUNSTDRAFT_56670 [Punctularia strigosozonata HHB-11173 SS5]EIN14655.1 hypothetical protein PUNSTDRAFT_56670 [Punctularia strigosozonata HHB-11173 SS5]
MDIVQDVDEIEIAPKQTTQKRIQVTVDDAHPFDLDSYITGYTGRTAIDRLLHIIRLCPTLAPQAYQLAVKYIHQGRDPSIYQTLIAAYETAAASVSGQLPPWQELAPLDTRWIEETNQKNQAERTKLEVELKTYSNNMIKESIRMGHRDLGDYYRAVGDQSNAIKHYTKCREFCTTSQHVLDMSISTLELLVERRSYAHITTYVFKAEAAMEAVHATTDKKDAASSAAAAQTLPPGSQAAAASKRSADKEKVQTKLQYATGLCRLSSGNYERAANSFLHLGPISSLAEWNGTLVSPSDIAIYGTLCALASLSRGAIKAQVLDNDNFGVYIEQEPYVRELLEAWMHSRFKTVLDLLERYSTRHLLDPHLSGHVQDLTHAIRSRALVLFFQPFASLKLERIGDAFGWPIEETEKQVVTLIQSGDIKARVDSQNKILKAKEVDPRSALFSRAIQSSADMQNATRKLLLRLKLQQAELVIKTPKSQGGYAHDILND